ncbi:hypothetical protein [Helicovermis profundi]|uniref:DUF5673 domain-containing protein n=1 Tax=Helicovermis profundi TaxID=3065157 RepID=A0AAU9E693_9FIRM|nr:hypothetical protein HLPR_04930 [Clostridia bacterium S502]
MSDKINTLYLSKIIILIVIFLISLINVKKILNDNKKIKNFTTLLFRGKKNKWSILNLIYLGFWLVFMIRIIDNNIMKTILLLITLIIAIVYFIRFYRNFEIYENGIITSNLVFNWKDVVSYNIFEKKNHKILELTIRFDNAFIEKERFYSIKLKDEESRIVEKKLIEWRDK